MRRQLHYFILLLIILAALTGCNLQAALQTPTVSEDSSPSPDGNGWEVFPAQVEQFEVQIKDTTPAAIDLLVGGILPDGCTELGEIYQAYDNGRFNIEVTARTPADGQACSDTAARPFTTTITLKGYELPAGSYSVDVNGLTKTFALSAEQAGSGSDSSRSISGKIFHDECALLKDTSGAVIDSSDGCVQSGDSYSADGVRGEDEKGIQGVLVELSQGECPASGSAATLADTTTGPAGTFVFSGLAPGSYCVSIDPDNNQNRPLMVPGAWTVSATSDGSISVTLDGASVPELLFGWDYEFLPVLDESNCENSFKFVDDITIPDDTEMSPGDTFVKTWRIQNDGTCTWSPEYKLVFTSGDQMSAPESVKLPSIIEPGSSVDISVDFTTPQADGTYRSSWQMQTPGGTIFGTGQDRNLPVWVQIKVGTATTRPDYGPADYTDEFNTGGTWYLGEDSSASFSIQNGQMVMVSKAPGSSEYWSFTSAYLSDFYIEMTAETGTCSGSDRYGLIVRAPDNFSGYLAGFTCDGKYSLRLSEDSVFQTIKGWTSSSHINTGPNQTNRLGILAQGSTLSLYANDVFLAEVTNDTFSEGRFGLFIASGATANFQVQVDSVSYWSSP